MPDKKAGRKRSIESLRKAREAKKTAKRVPSGDPNESTESNVARKYNIPIIPCLTSTAAAASKIAINQADCKEEKEGVIGGMSFKVDSEELEERGLSLEDSSADDDASPTCLICQNVRENGGSGGGGDTGECPFSSPCLKEFPTVSDQDNCYREELWAVFILRKLLDVPRSEVAALLRNTFGVNPSSWIGLCLECSGLVGAAVQLNYQIMKLERDLHGVKVEIQGKLSKSVELEEKPAIKEEDEGPVILNVHQMIRGSILDGINYRKSEACPPSCPATSSGFPLIDDGDEHVSATHPDVEDEVNSSDPEDDPLYEPVTLTTHRKTSPRKGRRRRPRGPPPPPPQVTSIVNDFKTEDENDDDDERESTDPLFIPEESEEEEELEEHHGAGVNTSVVDIPSLSLTSLLPKSSSSQQSGSNDDGPSRFTKDLSTAPKLSQGKSQQGRHLSFVCAICKFNCRKLQRYDRHMNNHKLYPNLSCHICSYPNSTEGTLKRHLALKHGIGALPAFKLVERLIVSCSSEEPGGAPGKREGGGGGGYQCKLCSYSSPSANRIVAHAEVHKYSDNISPVEGTTGKFRCKLCGFEGGGKTIPKHFVECHAAQVGMEPLLCHMCEKVYPNERSLSIHVQLVHGDARHSCSVCGKGFTRSRSCREHFEKCSNGGRNPVICDLCGTTFTCTDKLKRHLNKFHSEGGCDATGQSGREPHGGGAPAPPGKRKRPTKCKHCGVQFVHDKALKAHFRTAHPELYKYKCEQCDAAYMQPGGIKTHMEAKHLKQKANCPYCYKELSCAAFLKGHWAKHCKKLPPSSQSQEPAGGPPEVKAAVTGN